MVLEQLLEVMVALAVVALLAAVALALLGKDLLVEVVQQHQTSALAAVAGLVL
jgi:type II secretory pathway component PulJ